MSKIALYESTTPPTPPTGFLYLFARAGRLFTKSAAGAETPAFTPAGVVNAFAGAAAPSGWLLCDGSAVSRTAYPDLFLALGTTYGAGDGSTTFNLPDLRDRSPVGSSPTKSLASKAGSATVSLTAANIPPHNHTVSIPIGTTAGSNNLPNSGVSYLSGLQLDDPGVGISLNGPFSSTPSSGSTLTGTASGGGAATQLDVTNPYLALHYIIKT